MKVFGNTGRERGVMIFIKENIKWDKLGAKIDYESRTLQIGPTTIPFFYEYMSKELKPKTAKVHNSVRILVSIEQGDVVIPETKLTI